MTAAVRTSRVSEYEFGALTLSQEPQYMDEFVWARLRGARPSSGMSGEKPAGERTGGGYQNMVDEGLRLHRAFCSISNAALREAIVTLVVELTKAESVD
jgi:hypothetical protein